MPVLIALVGAAAAVFFFVLRARNAANAARDLADVANDVRRAARRFGFSRKSKQHPVEAIDDPDIAVTALTVAVTEMDGPPSKELIDMLHTQLRIAFKFSTGDATELMTLGRWLAHECGTMDQAVYRLCRRVQKLGAQKDLPLIEQVLAKTLAFDGGAPSIKQSEAIADIRRTLSV